METLLFVARYAKKYTWPLAVSVLSMIGLVAVQLVSPEVIRRLVALVSNPSEGSENLALITRLALVLLASYAVRAVLSFTRSYMSHVAGWGVVADARRDVYRHLQRLSLRFYADKQTGDLMSRMVNDSDMFERLIAHAIPDTLVNVLMFFGVVAVMVRLNWQLMLLTMIPVPLIVLAMQGFGKYVRPAFRARQKKLGELNATINDNFSGMREIKAFTREPIEAERVSGGIDEYRDSMLHALKLMATFGPFVEFASSLGTVVVIYFGGRLAFGQVLAIEDLVAFFLYLQIFYQPVRMLSTVWENIQEALAGADRVAELLQEEPDVDSLPGAVTLNDMAKGEMRFVDVGFAYETGERVLDGIDLHIKANSVTALVGPTGVGKTTLAGLIPRFYDVCDGRIELDGRDIRDVTLPSLRAQMSLVLQDVFLFHGTVRDNILFGKSTATEEEMIEAAKVANAHDFIMSQLPNGYDTLIGERGVKLSGGQKQRISIARAVLKDAPILILDEATSSVDTETEMLIQEALERLIVGRTTIVIAHRLSTVRNADLIVVLEGSSITETGTHEQLMAQDGLYRHLQDIQGLIATDPAAVRRRRREYADVMRN